MQRALGPEPCTSHAAGLHYWVGGEVAQDGASKRLIRAGDDDDAAVGFGQEYGERVACLAEFGHVAIGGWLGVSGWMEHDVSSEDRRRGRDRYLSSKARVVGPDGAALDGLRIGGEKARSVGDAFEQE